MIPELFLDFLIFENQKYSITKEVIDLDNHKKMVQILIVKNPNKTISVYENNKLLINFEKDIVLAKEYYLSYKKINFE